MDTLTLIKILYLIILAIIYYFDLRYMKFIKFKKNKKILQKHTEYHSKDDKTDSTLLPFITIIIICFDDETKMTLESIKYDKNRYKIIISKKMNDINFLKLEGEYIFVINNKMILSSDCIYDLINFSQSNNVDSVHCLLNYPNYKDNFILNIYYHYKYLQNLIEREIVFGKLIKISKIKNSKNKSVLLKKNLITQKLPFISSIPNDIFFYNSFYKNFNLYFLELSFLLFTILTFDFNFILYFILILFLNFSIATNFNYGINDFNIFMAIYITFFKILSYIFIFPNIILSNKINFPKLNYTSYIKPEYFNKINYDNGSIIKLKNYNLDIVKLKGNYFEMGESLGKIYHKELTEHLKLLDYIIPPFEINPLWKNSGYIARNILEKIKLHSFEYISNEVKDELKGISKGSNINLNDIILLSLFPCLFKAHCTILSDENIFIRTFDISLKSSRFSLIIYNPNNGNSYVSFSLPGLNWCVTGFSRNYVIGEVFNDNCKISDNKFGAPFFFNFKDLLSKTNTFSEIKNMINKLSWNDSIDISIKSMKSKDIILIEKRGNDSYFYDNNSFIKYLQKYSDIKDNFNKYCFYYNLDLIYDIINQFKKLNVEIGINSIIKGLETGSNHSLIIDFKKEKFYISNCDNEKEGYQKPLIEFNLLDILSEYD